MADDVSVDGKKKQMENRCLDGDRGEQDPKGRQDDLFLVFRSSKVYSTHFFFFCSFCRFLICRNGLLNYLHISLEKVFTIPSLGPNQRQGRQGG